MIHQKYEIVLTRIDPKTREPILSNNQTMITNLGQYDWADQEQFQSSALTVETYIQKYGKSIRIEFYPVD